MKFKIGQPVWTLGHCSGKWEASVIVGIYGGNELKCSKCGEVRIDTVIYAVDKCDLEPVPWGFPHWASGESMTRPRDPDQFKLADEDFDWQGLKAAPDSLADMAGAPSVGRQRR